MIDLKNLVRPNIWKLKAYSSARDEFSGKEGIFLDANENPYGELNRYPDPHQIKLKEKLAEIKDVEIPNIFIGNGSDEIIDLCFRIFCNPGIDKALTFSPTYGMYQVSSGLNDVELIKVPLDENFQIDLKELGNLIHQKDIESILKKFKGIVIVDEAYIDFANAESTLKLINDYDNLIVSQTFSKARGLAAARIGTAFSNQQIIALLNKIKPPYNISELNQKAALKTLNNSEVFDRNLKLILEEKERLKLALMNVKVVEKVYPSEANFLLLKVTDADRIYNELVRQKIITRNRNALVNNCIRISIGTASENDEFIRALNEMK